MSALQDSINTLTAILNRNDLTTALATTFIQQSQTRIERLLRVPGMETIGAISGNATAATDQIIIPANFLALKLLYTQGPSGGLDLITFKDVQHFFQEQKRSAGVVPKFYTRVGGSFLLTPVLQPGNTIWMAYYASQPQLIAPADQNFWTISCGDLLTYGALSFACDYFVDDRVQAFEARFTQLLSDIADQGRDTDMETSGMAIAPAYNTEY